MLVLAVFGPLDWGIVLAYFALVIVVGLAVARKDQDAKEYFLGNRAMPTWAVAVSLVATMLSAATFVGVPDASYGGDLSYLSLSIGGILAVFVVGFVFVPRLYQAGTVTIYGFLAQRFGEGARLAVSCAFIFGRLLGSGARLFLAAIPLCLLMFHAASPRTWQLVVAICLITSVGTFYTTMGGVRAVVWVDTIQFAIVVGAALLSIGLLLHRIPLSLPQIAQALSQSRSTSGNSKLHLVDWSTDLSRPYTIWAAAFATVFLNTAAYGVDQDLAQRFLISRSVSRGAISVIASQLIGIVVVCLFLFLGLLLYIFYQRPDLTGNIHAARPEGIAVYPWFLLNELPTVLSGFSIVGFFAIAQGSMDSAMNALASSIVADVYLPWRRRMGYAVDDSAKTSKLTVAAVGAGMGIFAICCAISYDPKNRTLLDLALGVLSFAYSGMLGTFLAALLTRRGTSATVVAALLVGAITVGLLQDSIMTMWTPHVFGRAFRLAWPWWMPIGTTLSFLVCVSRPGSSRVARSDRVPSPGRPGEG